MFGAVFYTLWYGYLPPLILVAVAALCAWKWESLWTQVLAAVVVLAVAGWQIWLTLLSMRGRFWDPAFHGVKLGILVLVVLIDVGAAWSVLYPRVTAAGNDKQVQGEEASLGRKRSGSQVVCVFLLMLSAVLYALSLPYLATTGE